MAPKVSSFLKRFVIICGALLVFGGGVFCFYVLRQARSAVAEGARAATALNDAPVSLVNLRSGASRFEPVLDSMRFESAAAFGGDLYVCGGGTLFRYSEVGLKQRWRAGLELPPTQLQTLAVRTGIGNPELWIATAGSGILIYDGTTFRQLLPKEPALRRISALLPLSGGQVLVGTQARGLYVSDGKSLRVFHPQFSLTQVTALAGDVDQLWIGTRNEGAWLWRGGEAIHLMSDLPDKQVLSLAASGDDAWVGTPLGVSEYKSGRLSRHLADGVFAQALAERDGRLWVGTVDQGAFAISLATEKPRPQLANAGGQADAIVSFVAMGGEMAAVQPNAVVDLSTNKQLAGAQGNMLANGHIAAVHEDSRGRLWIGYFDRGIDSVLQSGAGLLTHFENDTLFCINRIKENPRDGGVLVATANGLALFDAGGKLRQILNRENGLIASNVTDVLFQTGAAGEPGLAIATPAGLSFLEHGSISSVFAFHGLVNNHVYTLADLNGDLYAGTLGGVSSLRRGLVEASFNTANSGLRQNWITASAVFNRHLYLGTYGSGVVRFDGGGVVESSRSFAGRRFEINLNAMLATDRALYAGTAGQGLAILRAGDERWELIAGGLPSLNVTALDQRNGRLYVGTDNGLVRISENDLLP